MVKFFRVQVSHPEDVENYQDLAFARVKFNGDASGLPSGLTASFGKDIVTVNANGNDQNSTLVPPM